MTIQEKLEQLDKEIKELNLPFDKALPIFQAKLWKIAKEHKKTGPEVFALYMDWKSEKTK